MAHHSIIKKTVQIGGSTLVSRFLGIIRELLMVKYLGAGATSDAFVTAFKIPNSLRKLFAEGALSAAFIPSFIIALRKKKNDAESLMSLAFILFEGSLLLLCLLTIIFASSIIGVIAPGFSAHQVSLTVPFLRILMPFIFFVSSSALLAGALQSVGHFFVPAFGPILLNIIFIAGLLGCWWFNLPVTYLCFFIIFGGLLQFLQHLIAYWHLNFSFGAVTYDSWNSFKGILAKFCMCLISMSVMEISLFIDTSFASYLPHGSISLLYYANRFMGIPLGVFAVAFSTILLPHFSRISAYAPKRLNFYLLESAKLVLWVTLPAALLMAFLADKIFITLFVSDSFSSAQAQQAAAILIAFVSALFFFSFNKIILNVFYALHETKIPTIVSIIATVLNIILNFIFMPYLGAIGLALATSIAGIVQTFIMLYCLHRFFGFHGYIKKFIAFLLAYCAQIAVVSLLFLLVYYGILAIITKYLCFGLSHFLLEKIGFWLWVGPLCLLIGLLLYVYRNKFGTRLYFLD